ncbi:hypothetical protein BGX24_005968, partial [Mortierella sp. AD032]
NPASPGLPGDLPATPTSTPIHHSIHPMATIPDYFDALSSSSLSPPLPPPKSPLDRRLSASSSSSSPPTSSPLRRSSMTPTSSSSSAGDNSDKGSSLLSSSPPTPVAQNPAVAAVVTASSSKGSRRSSKLFGKLVPKFLQTSFGPNGPVAGGSSSPRSAVPVSPSPLSAMARPTRSASFTAGTPNIGTAVIAAGVASGSVGLGSSSKSALPQLPEIPAMSTSVLSSNEDWLGLNDGAASDNKESKDRWKTPSPVLSASPISAIAIESAQHQPAVTSLIAQFNMSIVTVEESVEGSIHSIDSAFERRSIIEQQDQEERPLPAMPQEDHLHFQKQDQHQYQQYQHQQHQKSYHYDEVEHRKESHNDRDDDHTTESTYIIDENCDDDFFLNSVLRKKNSTSSTNGHSTPSSRPPMLSTGSWGHGTTPSLSATSSSSQASSMAPSPTSPYPSMMYTPTPTPVSTTTATSLRYRSQSTGSTIGGNETTTQMVQSGLDEKRSRLRDAVGEWRRSANASLNSDESTLSPVSASTSYSGFAL